MVIVGAARTGTNLLRDVLTQLPGCGTWPCDEINYIWRHGNATYPSDEFGRELARPEIKRFIRRAFARIARGQGVQRVVEKTCANSLRVGFVDEVLPEARFLFLLRDGRDVIASAIKRWQAPLDFPYLYRKARYVPISDFPYYVIRYVGNRLFKLFSRKQHLASWGPRFEGMRASLETGSLPELCALQWRRCTERAEEELARVDAARVHRLRYEDLVTAPADEFAKIARFLDIEVPGEEVRRLVAPVRRTSMGKWRDELDAETLRRVEPVLEATLKRYGYV